MPALVPETQRFIDHSAAIGPWVGGDVIVDGADEGRIDGRADLDPAGSGVRLHVRQYSRHFVGQQQRHPYAELHCHSNFSFLDGASHPEELVDRAAALGLEALAVTDTNGLYGAVRFWNAAQERGLHAVSGTELRFADGDHLVLLAKDNAGWTNLCRLVSRGQLAGEKQQPVFTRELLAAHTEGLVCLSGCAHGAVSRSARAGDLDAARSHLAWLRELFGERCFVELQHHRDPEDDLLVDALAALADELGIGVVATNNVHYATPERHRLHDVLCCIDLGLSLAEATGPSARAAAATRDLGSSRAHRAPDAPLLKPNGEYFLKSGDELAPLFARRPDALANAVAIARACEVDLRFRYVGASAGSGSEAHAHARATTGSRSDTQRLPGFAVPTGHTAFSYLYELCHQGARAKYTLITPQVARQLARELDVIERAKLAEFFLINWDIVRFCKERDIPCQGRGSAANSIVAYVLDITKVDPIKHDLLFERFLSEDATTMPDIDLDIATNDREEVIQYVYGKYGADHSAMVCNVVTYRARLATREVAKALGFSAETVDRLAKAVDVHHADDVPESVAHVLEQVRGATAGGPRRPSSGEAGVGSQEELRPAAPLLFSDAERLQHFRALVREIADFPRHLSIHNGGMLITAAPLVDTVPVERATMPGRVVAQFDKRDVEDLGLIKMDLLGLRTLSLVKEARQLVAAHHATALDLEHLDLEDPAVYDLLCEVDTIGIFQVESRAQAQALPRVRPRSFDDIVVEVAIIRPGPLQGNAVNPYIRRRQGREPVAYKHPLLEPILAETLGVILFQEQILRVAMAVAGFTPGQADRLRRAISRARSAADMERLRQPFVGGAVAKGVPEATAHEIFGQIAGFAEFGFCKSHAAAFALTAYQTAHLKLYYPAEFFVALLNNQPMGFYSPAVVAGDAKRHGIRILPVDVNRSLQKARVEDGDAVEDRTGGTLAAKRLCRAHHVRLGFLSVDSVGEAEADALVAEREKCGPYRSFEDVASRVALKEEALRNLALVGAFDALEGDPARGDARRSLVWRSRDAHRLSPGFKQPGIALPPAPAPALPPLDERDRVALDYRLMGIPTGPQVMRFYREALARRGVLASSALAHLAHGRAVRVAGVIVVKQRPQTAKGHVFLSLEDEDGLANIIVRPRTYARYRDVLATSGAVVVEGLMQKHDGVLSVLARRLDPLDVFVSVDAHEWG